MADHVPEPPAFETVEVAVDGEPAGGRLELGQGLGGQRVQLVAPVEPQGAGGAATPTSRW